MRKTKDNIVISDVRFPNEIKAIHNAGGIVIRVKRGDDPEWFKYAEAYNKGPDGNPGWSTGKARLDKLKVHASEYSWVGGDIDYTIWNNSSIDDMFSQIKNIVCDEIKSKTAA
jgi:hypothetical protein